MRNLTSENARLVKENYEIRIRAEKERDHYKTFVDSVVVKAKEKAHVLKEKYSKYKGMAKQLVVELEEREGSSNNSSSRYLIS